MTPSYQAGETFEIRGQRWTLARLERFAACTVLTLGGSEASNVSRTLRVIDPFDRPRAIARPKVRRRPRRAVLRAALGALASARSPNGLWSAADASIDVLPYQLELRALLARRARVEYQRSLFDGRADAEAAVRGATSARLDAALDRILRATGASIHATRGELIAVWSGRRR